MKSLVGGKWREMGGKHKLFIENFPHLSQNYLFYKDKDFFSN